MKKKLGLLVLASATLLIPSCGRKLYRKVASQLVATYTQFVVYGEENFDKVSAMINEVKMHWDYSGTDESEIEIAKQMVTFMTGAEDPLVQGTTTINKENPKYGAFFELGEEFGRDEDKKDYPNEIIRWNLISVDSQIPTQTGFETVPVFDAYYPENADCKFEAKVNDLYVTCPVFGEGIKIGEGSYHYDSMGRLVSESVHLNISKTRVSLEVNASYNPIKKD